MEVIARIRNDFPMKFGLPRQAGLAPSLRSKIVFEPAYRVPEALRGLEGFSHIWLIWGFSAREPAASAASGGRWASQCDSSPERWGLGQSPSKPWSPTVRPPRLGGNVRIGVFATRSPFRPNPIGLSSVRLESIEEDGANGRVLIVSGADLMDGTPIYDIKPYLPGVDAHPEAADGFVGTHAQQLLEVELAPELADRLSPSQLSALREILAQDPRPAYHATHAAPGRIYGFSYAGLDIHFTVADGRLKAF
ncbi:MAG: SAM-dependent methyltransferase [Bacteroidales bacterium]|nr:SAM-dependent methyltransferase [Bacteroidales bacterium]